MAVGRRTGTVAGAVPGGEELAKSVTLLCTAEQAETIDLATHVGTPRLILRNVADEKMGSGKGITVADLRGAEEPQPPRIVDNGKSVAPVVEPVKADPLRPRPQAFRDVQVIRGGATSVVRVPSRSQEQLTDTKDKLLEDLPNDR
jgi:Flp pilus assembly protein CpaB